MFNFNSLPSDVDLYKNGFIFLNFWIDYYQTNIIVIDYVSNCFYLLQPFMLF